MFFLQFNNPTEKMAVKTSLKKVIGSVCQAHKWRTELYSIFDFLIC